MKPDEFEKALARIPLQAPPPAWRDEILESSRNAAIPSRPLRIDASPSLRSLLEAVFRRLATPWTALATVAASAVLLNATAQFIAADGRSTRPTALGADGPSFADIVRNHRSEVLALLNPDESDSETPIPANSPIPQPAGKPRSQVQPAGGRNPEQPIPSNA